MVLLRFPHYPLGLLRYPPRLRTLDGLALPTSPRFAFGRTVRTPTAPPSVFTQLAHGRGVSVALTQKMSGAELGVFERWQATASCALAVQLAPQIEGVLGRFPLT